MITHARIKAKYRVEPIEGEGIFLLSENECHLLEGAGMTAVVPLLDGTRSWHDVLDLVGDRAGRDNVLQAFDVLQRHGHVEQADAVIPDALRIFWTELGCDPAAVISAITGCNLRIVTVGAANPQSLEHAATLFGFSQASESPAGLMIVAADTYRASELHAVNEAALAHGTPWVLVRMGGLRPLVGPFFRPGQTACWRCLESRLRHNAEIETYVERRRGLSEPLSTAQAHIPLADAQVASITMLQIARWLATGHNPSFESRIVSIDLLTSEQAFHTVIRRPQCPSCGVPAAAHVGGRPIALRSHDLVDRGENGFRSEPPNVTFARYSHHVSDVAGVVKHVLPSPWNGTGPLKSYVAGHNFALNNRKLHFLKAGLRTTSSGKGKTDEQARTSALCEALERYSGLWRNEEETRFASFEDMRDEAIDPTTVTLFSERQYAERDAWLARGERFQVVPEAFDPAAPIHWSPLWSLTRDRRVWLPTSLLYFGFCEPDDRLYFWSDSNGNAAGSSIEDAILQGFLELVERDAVAIWWYNRVPRPKIDLDTLSDPFIARLQRFLAEHRRTFWVLDLTSDLGIPAFAAVSPRLGGGTEDIVIGFGAHLDARIGIMRAITEMNQFLPALLSKNPDGTTAYGFDDPASVRWWSTAKLSEQTHLLPSPAPPRAVGDLPSVAAGDIVAQIEMCRSRVEALGHEVLVLDQTRPDIGLPTAKVIVPGLRHFWARFAPGRLYDVPVKLGWLEQPLTEEQLNPIAMFV